MAILEYGNKRWKTEKTTTDNPCYYECHLENFPPLCAEYCQLHNDLIWVSMEEKLKNEKSEKA